MGDTARLIENGDFSVNGGFIALDRELVLNGGSNQIANGWLLGSGLVIGSVVLVTVLFWELREPSVQVVGQANWNY